MMTAFWSALYPPRRSSMSRVLSFRSWDVSEKRLTLVQLELEEIPLEIVREPLSIAHFEPIPHSHHELLRRVALDELVR